MNGSKECGTYILWTTIQQPGFCRTKMIEVEGDSRRLQFTERNMTDTGLTPNINVENE